ncbi:MAG: glycosyltransferase [Thermoplasmata archaeon]|nr:glycosyltransferase [Thermoplasmata archaeon]
MLPLAIVLLLVGLGLFVLLFQGVPLYFAAGMPLLGPGSAGLPRTRERLAVVVAARNEELDLPRCLDDLHAQKNIDLDLVVVDGGSSDGTREVVAARSAFVRLVPEPPLPAGWVGKSWALDTGARATRGEWILFTDADMRFHADAVASALAWGEKEGADLVTLAPPVEMHGFWENVVLPFYAQMVLTYFRVPRVNRDNSRSAMANGQFLLVRRASYEAVGGHTATRSFILEDVGLARAFRDAGLRLRVAWAPELLTTRMYRTNAEMYEGLLKLVHGLRFSAWRQSAFLVGLVGGFLLPLALLPVGLLTGTSVLTVFGAVLVAALFGKHVGFTRAVRGRAVYGLLYPVAVGYYLVLVTASLVRGIRRRPIAWKGRTYPYQH